MNFIDIKIHGTTIKTWTAVSYHLGCEEMRLLLCCGILGIKTWLLVAVVYVCEQVWEGWQGPIPTGYCADGLTICGLSECCGTRYEGWLSLQWESQLSRIPLQSSIWNEHFHSCMEKAEHRKTKVLSKQQTVPDTATTHPPKCIPNTGL